MRNSQRQRQCAAPCRNRFRLLARVCFFGGGSGGSSELLCNFSLAGCPPRTRTKRQKNNAHARVMFGARAVALVGIGGYLNQNPLVCHHFLEEFLPLARHVC